MATEMPTRRADNGRRRSPLAWPTQLLPRLLSQVRMLRFACDGPDVPWSQVIRQGIARLPPLHSAVVTRAPIGSASESQLRRAGRRRRCDAAAALRSAVQSPVAFVRRLMVLRG